MTNRSPECTSYNPGHRVHWIQEKLARAGQPASSPVTLVERRGPQVEVIVDGGMEVWQFHDTPITRGHLDAWDRGEAVEMRPHGLLRLTGGGSLYPCRDPQQWQDC